MCSRKIDLSPFQMSSSTDSDSDLLHLHSNDTFDSPPPSPPSSHAEQQNMKPASDTAHFSDLESDLSKTPPTPLPPSLDKFGIAHLNFRWAVTGIKGKGAKREQLKKVRLWMHKMLCSHKGFMSHMKRTGKKMYKRIMKGPYFEYIALICPVYNCKNSRCSRKHTCSECAIFFKNTAPDHQFGTNCPIHNLICQKVRGLDFKH